MESLHENQYLVGTVQKAINILDLLANQELPAARIAAELKLNKSTIHRLLYTLENAGYIEKEPGSANYRIGLKIVELSTARLNDIEIKTEAKPYLLALVEQIRQPVHLGIYSDGNAVFIDKIDIASTMRIYSAIGKTIPIYCSAIGKALILDRSDEEILEILKRIGMKTFTPSTITDPAELIQQIHEARKTGFTVDMGEHEADVYCLAVPIFDYRGEIIAAISTAMYQTDQAHQAQLVELLKSTSNNISRRLGWNPQMGHMQQATVGAW